MYTKAQQDTHEYDHTFFAGRNTDAASRDTSSHVGLSRGTARWWLLELSGDPPNLMLYSPLTSVSCREAKLC